MPLTKTGKKKLKEFNKEYGAPSGEGIFYAYMNKHPKITQRWHKKE